MDRLYAVVGLVGVVLVVAAGCENDSSDAESRAEPASRGRVNAVQAKSEPEAPPPEAFCDVYNAPGDAPEFSYPKLDGEAPDPPKSGWHWVNLWATWCKPCIEEMPRLVKWESEMQKLGKLTFLSTDESREVVEKFRKEHPDTPESVRIADPDQLQPWLKKLGLFEGASLPIHIFVDPGGELRCARAGGISDNDRAAVEKLLAE